MTLVTGVSRCSDASSGLIHDRFQLGHHQNLVGTAAGLLGKRAAHGDCLTTAEQNLSADQSVDLAIWSPQLGTASAVEDASV